MCLKNKIVLVAGGKSIALISVVEMLLNETATVVVVAQSANVLNFIKETAIVKDPAKLITILIDYPDYYKAVEIINYITETFGRIDICVFCFKSSTLKLRLLETEITDWEKMIESNISAYYVAVKSVFETMKQSRQGLFVSIQEGLPDSDSPLSKLAQLSNYIHKEMARMFFEELRVYGITIYYLYVNEVANAENAGPFILQLCNRNINNGYHLFLQIPGRAIN